MRGGVLLLIAAILMAYLGVSGKYKCFTSFVKCLVNGEQCSCNESTATPTNTDATDKTSPNVAANIRLPQLPRLPKLPSSGGNI